MFLRALRDFGVSPYLDPNAASSYSDLQFAYNECTSQIVMAIGADVNRFMMEMKTSPDYQFLQHISQFHPQNLTPQFLAAFHARFLEYAVGLMTVIQTDIGLRFELDYLLEAVAEDYIVIMTTQRTI